MAGIDISEVEDGALAGRRYITLEGLIGSGKSSLLQNLGEIAGGLFSQYQEPVDRWTAVSLGRTDIDLLRVFYEHRNEVTSNLLQIYVSMSIFDQERQIDDMLTRDSMVRVFSERNLSSSKYFIRGLQEMGSLTEAHADAQMAYSQALQDKISHCPTKIFLDIPVGHALDRIKQRGRGGEQCLDETYLSVIERQIRKDIRAHDFVLPFDEKRSSLEAAVLLKRKLFSQEELSRICADFGGGATTAAVTVVALSDPLTEATVMPIV